MANLKLLTGLWLDQELGTADSTILFTSTRRSQAVNDGYAEFCERTECLLETGVVLCSSTAQTYNLLSSAILIGSTNLIRLAPRGVEFIIADTAINVIVQMAGDDFPRRDIEVMNREDPGWRTSSAMGIPTSYFVDLSDGEYTLGLDTLPDIGSSQLGFLMVPFTSRPRPMTSTGDIPFTVSTSVRFDLYPFHKALVHYAASQLEKLRSDAEASDRQLAIYESYVQRFYEKAKNKGSNFVRLARNYLKEAGSRRSWNGAWDPRRDFE